MIMRCKLEIALPQENAAEAAAQAVSHEGSVGSRARSKVTRRDKTLLIEIEADDVVALRATANAYLRALQTVESIEEVSR
jgi:tRNA threonylcarbamoyladenosine modification (KEOPS) complex  Pcc1 subunit